MSEELVKKSLTSVLFGLIFQDTDTDRTQDTDTSFVLVEHSCKFRLAEDIYFRGKRFQAVSARNCFTEFAAVNRHKFYTTTVRKEAKIETCWMRDVFVDGENIIKWRDEF